MLLWLELVFPGAAVPANIAALAVAYSAITWTAPAGETLECRYLVVDADGTMRRDSIGLLEQDGSFRIDLEQLELPPGRYTVLVTLIFDGNRVHPDIRAVPYEVS